MKFIFWAFILISQVTIASGIATLDGKMYGKTERSFSILVKGNIYFLDKKQLSLDQGKDLEKAKWGSPISIRVPFSSIQDVKTAKAK